jgi:hypothetical protein
MYCCITSCTYSYEDHSECPLSTPANSGSRTQKPQPPPCSLSSICFSVPFTACGNVYLIFEESYTCLNVMLSVIAMCWSRGAHHNPNWPWPSDCKSLWSFSQSQIYFLLGANNLIPQIPRTEPYGSKEKVEGYVSGCWLGTQGFAYANQELYHWAAFPAQRLSFI